MYYSSVNQEKTKIAFWFYILCRNALFAFSLSFRQLFMNIKNVLSVTILQSNGCY